MDWSDRPAGVASSAAAQGIGRTITPLAVWAGYWSLAAVLFLLPANRTHTSIQSAIAGMADGAPGWYAHFLTSLANLFSDHGDADGVDPGRHLRGPSGSDRSWPAAPAGSWPRAQLLSFLMWIAGQGLVGNVFTGSGTDPNTGPLVILLAAAMVPTVIAAKGEWRSPAGESPAAQPGVGRPRHRAPSAPRSALSASYPAVAAESTDSAMAGMAMAGTAAAHGSGDGVEQRHADSGTGRPPRARACRTRTVSRSPASTWPTRRT